ncbi:MAG: hypothetical protein IJD88_01570 [Clostridia bacterium]|nr:hypothetical protein [Clostridia bacterium]
MKKLLSKNRLIFLGIILILIAVATAVFFGISHFNPDNTETENSIQDVADGNLYNSSALPSTSSYADIENAILIDDILQEHLNIFLSTFSEVSLQSFSDKTSKNELIGFGYLYNRINRYQDTVEKADITINETYCSEKLSYNYIVQAVQKYFGITLSDKDFQSHPFYKDEYIYAESSTSKDSVTFSIAHNIKAIGDGLYQVDFAFYNVSTDEFNPIVHKMSPSDAASKNLEKSGSGCALISAENLNEQETYILKEYSLN